MADNKKKKPATKKTPVTNSKPEKPSKRKTTSRKKESGETMSGRGFTLSLKGDRSLQAYKNWVRGMILSIVPDAEDTMTEEEWVRKWKEFWAKADDAEERKKKGTSEDEDAFREKWKNMSLEERYPGITEQIHRFANAKLPPCPHCGSKDTASVQVGVIGRTINIAGSTRKFHLVMNMSDKKGEYFCNNCRKFFD